MPVPWTYIFLKIHSNFWAHAAQSSTSQIESVVQSQKQCIAFARTPSWVVIFSSFPYLPICSDSKPYSYYLFHIFYFCSYQICTCPCSPYQKLRVFQHTLDGCSVFHTDSRTLLQIFSNLIIFLFKNLQWPTETKNKVFIGLCHLIPPCLFPIVLLWMSTSDFKS